MNEEIGLSTKFMTRFKDVFGFLIFFALSVLSYTSSAAVIPPLQQSTITGKIVDTDGIPVPGVNIVVEDTQIGAVADFDGMYSIDVPQEATTLVYTAIGFETQKVDISGRTQIDITLTSNVEQLESVVVVGYGTQKKSDITGSVASIQPERLEQLPNNNFAQALQGSVAGVNVTTPSGGAEQNDASIIIRGRNSINANNGPLIVLDGIPYTGGLSDIVPTDIKSIEVLKDASASAIYGSRGANGVILITTKKGQLGKVTISYDSFYSVQDFVDVPDVMTPAQFYDFKETREPGSITPSEQELFENNAGTDWLDLATRQGSRSQHTFTVSGGSESIKYFFSANRLDVTGITLGDDFDRSSLRINVSANLNDWIELGTNTQLQYSDRSGLAADLDGARGGFYANPLTSAFNDDGTYRIYPWPEDINFENPLADVEVLDKNLSYDVFTNNYLQLDFPFLEGLSYRLNTGIRYSADQDARYYDRKTTARGFEDNGEARRSNELYRSYLVENILSYDRTFGKHKVSFTGLYSASFEEREYRRLFGEGFPNDVLTYYQMDVAALLSPASSYTEQNLVSQMGRLNYVFDERYLATFTVRRDGYSGFGSNRKYGTFPSVALGWNVYNESFFPQEGVVNQLKIRASYGENGNQAVDPYQTLSTYNESSYVNGGTSLPGYTPGRLGNPDLGWETSKSVNLGLDFGLFRNRINGSFNMYRTNTFDLLLNRAISSVHGTSSILQNIGETKNNGFEVSLSTINIVNNNFQWTTDINFSHNKNEIVDLYGDGNDDVANRWFIGQPIRVNYGLQFDGIFQEGDDIANSAQPDAEPGYVKIRDINGDGEINSDSDRTIIGQSDPRSNWGFSNNFTYDDFSLYVLLQGVQGITKNNQLIDDNVYGEVRRNTVFLPWWTPQNRSNKYWANDIDANNRAVNIYEKADFVRIKDISLSYNLPSELMEKIGFNRIKLYATGRNLFTFTSFEGVDPEMNDQRDVPIQKEILLGLNLSF